MRRQGLCQILQSLISVPFGKAVSPEILLISETNTGSNKRDTINAQSDL